MKKSTKWFLAILSFLLLVALGIVLLTYAVLKSAGSGTEFVTTGAGKRIAVIELTGTITSSEDIVRQFKRHRRDNSIKAILFRVDSPGGGVVASQEIYEEVRMTRDGGKPVVASMGSVAASGGYYVSLGASTIVANPGTLTGSVGVIAEFLQLGDALDKLGISVRTIKSGKLKDAGSRTRKMTEDDRKYFQSLLDDVHVQFVEVVERERGFDPKKAIELSDGRVFTGVQALGIGLIDTLGTFEDAVRIAADLAGITGDPALVRERKKRGFWDSMFGEAAAGLTEIQREVFQRPVLSYRFVGP
jgi:protease-4